jgi:hypothetical protein
MIPLLYQLSYTAPRKFRGIRYWITAFLSRKTVAAQDLDKPKIAAPLRFKKAHVVG